LRKPQFWFGLLVLGPMLIWYAVIGIGPILRAFWMAVFDYNIVDRSRSVFVGLGNFAALLRDELFWISLKQTVIYSVVLYVVMLPLALVLALSLTSIVRGRRFFEFVVFLPVVVSLLAIAQLFYLLLNPGFGPVNRVLGVLGLPQSRFLEGTESALYTVAGVDVWKSVGFYVVILAAGLLNVPQELYDAAKVDGAGAWQRFWKVTLPLLAHTLALVSVLIAMAGLQVFTLVVVMPYRPGQPGTATYVMNLLVWKEAFQMVRFGRATATAFVLFLFVLAVTVVQLRLIRPRWSY
jgi:ABC-type sugar transport system permease subunit